MIDYEKSYLGKNLNSLSTLGNTLTHGDRDVSISARIGYNYLFHKNLFWVICRAIVDFTFYPIEGWGHCETAYKKDMNEQYTPNGVLWGLVLMCILMIVFCSVLSILFWGYKGIKSLLKHNFFMLVVTSYF